MTVASENLQIQVLQDDYAAGRRSPLETLQRAHARALEAAPTYAWITLLGWDSVAEQLQRVDARRAAGEALPLYGVPFAVKDNIDVAGVLTTAACPSYARTASASAPVVEALCRAGAIVLGKTNLDQFATGLVGVRSPYGACSSAFAPEYISGGSSSGSALAVALGHVSFALGTDTAGSGRVPAAFNNIVGLKPTRGWLSTRGVVPACRSLDCVSVFAGSVADAWRVSELAAGFDRQDDFSRAAPPGQSALPAAGFRFGVPRELEFFGDGAAQRAFQAAVARLTQLGGTPVEVDFAPFRQAAELLYQGPWLAERALAFGEHVAHDGPGIDPTVAAIVRGAGRHSALDAFRAHYRLQELRRATEAVWRELDVLVVPTTATSYTHAQLAEQPIELNSRLGIYTNFTNLLDLCGLALPAGLKSPRLPFGITLLAPAFCDRALAQLGQRWEQSGESTVGATGVAVAAPAAALPKPPPAAPVAAELAAPVRARQSILLAVVGAHLSGQPLHRELVELGARLERAARTAPRYRLYALANTTPAKPGLMRVSAGGSGIELEVYRLDAAGFGQFVANVGAPLGIGNVELEGGEWVKGFLCEAIATEGAQDISQFGGWRGYLAARR